MADTPSDRTPFEDLGRKFDNALPKVEEEVQKVIAYLNDKVVPEVREHSSDALRIAAEHMHKLADYLDRGRKE